MRNVRDSYEKLCLHQKRTLILQSSNKLLCWDREINLSDAAVPFRAEQQALLAGLAHSWDIDPKIGDWLSDCEDSELMEDPFSAETINVREWRRDYERNRKIPQRLVEEIARTAASGHNAWLQARDKSHFKTFLPWFERIIHLKREYAYTIGYDEFVYDALIDEFEPGETTDDLTDIFKTLCAELVPLITRIVDSNKSPKPVLNRRNYPVDKQIWLGKMLTHLIGFDYQRGRLDSNSHPFCMAHGPNDVRIANRWDTKNFATGIFGILHELGHGLYNQGLPESYWGTPAGSPVSFGIHESQSRLWENLVGRSTSFWRYFYPQLQATFMANLSGVKMEDIEFAVNEVHPDLIRTDADEVTYILHIVLRFEIEQSLISGRLFPEIVPEVWNENFENLFGKKVPDDKHGCLQDVHWSLGNFGYFPSYALGNIFAAQLYHQANLDINGLENEIAKGNFIPLLEWLKKNIYSQGMKYNAKDLIKKVTKEPPNPKYFLNYLKKKYTRLYEL